MAARLTRPLRESMQRRGVKFVSPSDSLSAMELLLDESEPHALVTQIQWATYLARLNQAPPGLLCELASEHSPEASVGRTDKASLGSRLAAAPDLERRTILMDHVRSVLTRVLRFSESEVIEPRRGLFDLGMDSLSAMEIKSSIEYALGCAIPTTALLDFPTLGSFVNHLHDEILGYAPRVARAREFALGA
jgi:acyl carrier protein